jgi:dTDP-4-amino-4,6-dideoxygalactose transaminase
LGKLIPFNLPHVPEISKQYVAEALESSHQQGDGPFTAKASKIVSNLVGGGHVLLTPSCTHALEMASMLANIGPGDEVILPSYTFTSAATAITKFGARPVFVDIDLVTKGINVEQVRDAITPNTKAISWVNYAGVAPDIESLQRIAREFGLLLIEDNAHGLGGTYQGKPLGSFGDFATLSFHATKNIQCGEGGALVVNNPEYIERAEIIREKGTDRSRFIRGEVQKYQWVDHGSSYLLAEVLAAQLLGQLEKFDTIQSSRQKTWENYELKLGKKPIQDDLNAEKLAYHMYYIEIDPLEISLVQEKLKSANIATATHYQPLHLSKMGVNLGANHLKLPNTELVSKSLLRIPLWVGMAEKIVNQIVDSILLADPRSR